MFLPREKKFFGLYEALVEKIIEAVTFLEKLQRDYSNLPQVAQDLNKLEDEADEIVHQIINQLLYDHTRVTEEKGDIRHFAQTMDNIIDFIEKAVNRLYIYRVKSFPGIFSEILPLLKESVQQIKIGVCSLRNIRKNEKVLADCCIRINDLENEADQIHRNWLAKIMTNNYRNLEHFQSFSALKEIIDILEYTVDECEDVANILETFRLKGGS
ncbi:MAG: DUF47 domain-containing protein [bacterium]